jgi:hypothetical protein
LIDSKPTVGGTTNTPPYSTANSSIEFVVAVDDNDDDDDDDDVLALATDADDDDEPLSDCALLDDWPDVAVLLDVDGVDAVDDAFEPLAANRNETK